MPLTAGETYYTFDEAAEILSLSLRTIRNLVAQGLIVAESLSSVRGNRMIRASEIERFKTERRPRGNPNFQRPTHSD